MKGKGNKVLNSLITRDSSQCKGPAKVPPLSSLTDGTAAFSGKRVRGSVMIALWIMPPNGKCCLHLVWESSNSQRLDTVSAPAKETAWNVTTSTPNSCSKLFLSFFSHNLSRFSLVNRSCQQESSLAWAASKTRITSWLYNTDCIGFCVGGIFQANICMWFNWS